MPSFNCSSSLDLLLCNIYQYLPLQYLPSAIFALLQFIRETYAQGLKQMQLATEHPCTIKRSES